MSKSVIVALDQGTTSSRAILFDKQGRIVSSAQKEFTQFFPKPGFVEHDPMEIWSSQISVTAEALSKVNLTADQVKAIGITNQRETTVVWNRHTGKPVYNAIVWQDRRTANHCLQLKKEGHSDTFREKTGLLLDAYFSGTKIAWILNHVEGARAQAERGDLLFGTVDSWLLWKLTDGAVHATDVTNASRTLLFNIHTMEWDDALLGLLQIPAAMLPEVRPSSHLFGETSGRLFSGPVPVGGMAGDQQAALFGQVCTHKGMTKNTYGTGCFMLMQTGETPIPSKHRLLTTVAWQLDAKPCYALEGSIFIGGAVVQWLRDGLGLIASSDEVETLAAQVPDSDGVYLVPAFSGLGSPHWDPFARGTLNGITRGTQKAHIARAALESIAFQSFDLLKSMEADSGVPLKEMRVDGGASVNNLLMQFQADLLERPVIRPVTTETTALGAAYLAGLTVGYWGGVGEIETSWQEDRRFDPSMSRTERETRLHYWEKAVGRSMNWMEEE